MFRHNESAGEPDVSADRENVLEEGMLTLVGAVGALLVAVVAAVVVAVTGPVLWDAAATVALELHARTGVTAACFVAVVPTVIIYTQTWTSSICAADTLTFYPPRRVTWQPTA